MCNFAGFQPPEMTKNRLVVVLTHKRPQIATVVPISATEPNTIENWHHELDKKSLPQRFRDQRSWAKCDMVTTVSLSRLDRIMLRKNKYGQRTYGIHQVSNEDLEAIQRGVLETFGLAHLILTKK